MADSCFIYKNPPSFGETVNVEHGLQTLKNVINDRDDRCIAFFKSVSVTFYVQCRKKYTGLKNIDAIKRQCDENAEDQSNHSPHTKLKVGISMKIINLSYLSKENVKLEIYS